MEDKKKYNYMENVLNKINQKYISLNDTETKQNNVILAALTQEIISKLKKDPLFEKLFRRIYYGGSYYDGLKVGNPEEFDLDLLLVLPKILEVELEDTKKPGFIYVYAKEFAKYKKSEEASKYPKLENLMIEDKYFSTKKVRSWVEKLMTNVLKEFHNNQIDVEVNGEPLKIDVKVTKSGPAFTFAAKTNFHGRVVKMDVDLVACFLLTDDKWPKGYKSNPSKKKDTFFVVPKKPYTDGKEIDEEKYWRFSFQEQERDLITGKNFKGLKPSLKLIKQLRNYQNHKGIASYFIKTVFLWEVEKQPAELWCNTFSFIFMTMLKKYAEYLKNGKIPYYWHPNFNLIGHMKQVTYTDFGNAVKNIIDEIERNINDPFVIAKRLLPNEDVETLKKEVNLGKKHHKNHQIQACLNRSIGSGNPNIQFPIKFDPSNSEHVTALLTDDYFKKVVKWFIETYFKDMESKDGSAVAKKIIETCDLESQPGCSHNDNNNGAVNNMDSSCSDIEEVCDQVNLIDLSENNTRSNITSLKNLGDITTDNPCETFSMQDRDLKAENERLRKDNEVLLKMNSQLCETLNSSLKHTNENIKTLVENVCQMLKEKETTFNTNERLHAFRNEALKEPVLYKWDSQIDDIMKVPSLSEPKAIYESTLVTADLFEKRNGQGVTLLQSTSKEGPANKTAQEVPVTPDELASHAFNNFFDFNFL